MKTPESKYISFFDNVIICPVCKNRKFWSRTTLMNTSGMTFMGWDWLNKEAVNFICSKCGYVYWFFEIPPDALRTARDEAALHEPRKPKEKKEQVEMEEGWWLK